MLRGLVLSAALLLAGCAHTSRIAGSDVLFRSGEGGYNTYRIPAIVTTKAGTVLAFCEGRKSGRSDAGDIDLLLRRSTDGGRSWGPVQVVVDDGDKTCGNPCPIVDRASGDIVLLITTNGGADFEHKIQKGEAPPRIPWVLRSADDGATWSAPRDISETARKPHYRWYATGPGHGIQLRGGRMIAPCDHSTGPGPDEQFAHLLYSDDAGHTWAHGATLGPRTNECSALELDADTLYLSARNHVAKNLRVHGISKDKGETFGPIQTDTALTDPVCEASTLRLDDGDALYLNPASTRREYMTLRRTTDNAATWTTVAVLHAGPAAYSDLTLLPGGDIGCLYECGESEPYETITFKRVRLER